METQKIVITGGPSTGKTAVVEELENLGHHCMHEVIRTMTQKEKAAGKDVKMVSNPIISVEDPMQFNLTILNARIEQYNAINSSNEKIVFFDRGIGDVLAYMDCFEQEYGETFTQPCKNMRYNHIFLMPPWKEIHVNDGERFESFEESLRIHECLHRAYERFGYKVITVPKTTVEQRIKFILNHVKMD